MTPQHLDTHSMVKSSLAAESSSIMVFFWNLQPCEQLTVIDNVLGVDTRYTPSLRRNESNAVPESLGT